MRLSLLTLFACVGLSAAQELDEGVLVLTEANFESAIADKGALLVEFYAPWCGHCKKLAPEYAAAAKELAAEGLFIAKVDATVEKDLASRFGIQGFPTLKYFRAGAISTPIEYSGGRETAAIVSWVRKKSGPRTKVLASPEDATAFVATPEVAVIAFVSAGSSAAAAIDTAAGLSDDIPFATSDSDDVRAAYGVAAGAEAIISVNKFTGQDNVVTFSGDASDATAVNTWVQANSMPIVVAFTPESAPKIFRGSIKTHYLLFVDPEAADTAATLDAFRGVARTGGGRCLFVTVDPAQDRVLSYFGIKKEDMPTASIVFMPEGGSMKKFMLPAGGSMDEATLSSFLESYTSGALKPFLKSAPPPEDNSAAVKVLVGSTFAPLVKESNLDIALVEFYAPWCGHCKALAPVWDELGAHFAGVEGVGIFKMDATENEVDDPAVNVKGFPTIIAFVKASDGSYKAIEYDGSRDLDGFTAFVTKNAPKKLAVGVDAATGAADDLEL